MKIGFIYRLNGTNLSIVTHITSFVVDLSVLAYDIQHSVSMSIGRSHCFFGIQIVFIVDVYKSSGKNEMQKKNWLMNKLSVLFMLIYRLMATIKPFVVVYLMKVA